MDSERQGLRWNSLLTSSFSHFHTKTKGVRKFRRGDMVFQHHLHIDAALAGGLQGVHPRDIGQSLLLKYQPVGSLNVESVLEILSGCYSQVDFLR